MEKRRISARSPPGMKAAKYGMSLYEQNDG